GRLADLRPEERRELLTLAASLLSPDRVERRRLSKAFRRKDRALVRARDEERLAETGMRALRKLPVFETPRPGELPASAQAEREPLDRPRTCYICKDSYRTLHFFYDSLCPKCGDFNWEKRNQSVSLEGRVALITGARVKIGYQAAIKL